MIAAPGRLLVVGAGGHGRVVADVAEAGGWEPIGFLDDRFPTLALVDGWPVVGCLVPGVEAGAWRGASYVVAVGDNRRRLEIQARLEEQGRDMAVIIHPGAAISRRAAIGAGTVVFPKAVINTGARLGRAVIVNTGAVIEHDNILEDGVHVSPGAILAGTVHVGAETWVGAGAVVRHNLRLGARVRVGAGAAVVADVPDDLTVVGVPARPR